MKYLDKYHRLPSFMKDIVASGYGFLQKKRRYGEIFHKLVKEFEETQWYSLDQHKEYQRRKLKLMLIHCSENVPYYRSLFKKIAVDPDKEEPFTVLSRLPILDKQTIKEKTEQFVAGNIPKKELLIEHTSGSTGTPLQVYQTKKSQQYNYALTESRSLGWAGLKHTDRKVMFGGRPIIPMFKKEPPFWVTNISENQLYCSSYHISLSTLSDYHNKINEYQPNYITGYASAIALYAGFLLRSGEKIESVKAILPSSETLTINQRNIMEEAFECKIRNSYSLAEYVNFISECTYQNLHISPEAGVVEILDDNGVKVNNGAVGKIISTTLFNLSMPLIRYDTGDLGSLEKEDYICNCGRNLPVLKSLDGRKISYIILPNGSKVGTAGLTTAFHCNDIVESQFVQESRNDVELKLVVTEKFNDEDLKHLMDALYKRLSPLEINVGYVDSIPVGSNGKRPWIVNNNQTGIKVFN